MTDFKQGQRVRIKESEQVPGSNFNNHIFRVHRYLPATQYTKAEVETTLEGVNSIFKFSPHRLEHVEAQHRTVGNRIHPSLIQVGDKIKCVWEVDDLSMVRMGYVGKIKEDSICSNKRFRTHEGHVISFGAPEHEHFVLLEKGDPILNQLLLANGGQVIQFGKHLARKKDDNPESRWVVFYPNGQSTVKVRELRDRMDDEPQFLVAQ